MPIFIKTNLAKPNDPKLNHRLIILAKKHSELFGEIVDAISPGVSTAALAQIACESAKRMGIDFSYRSKFGFPDDISVGINHEIMNSVPRVNAVIEDGDLVKLAFGTTDELTAFCTQHWTVSVGKMSASNARLMSSTKRCLDSVVRLCVPGAKISSLVHALGETSLAEGIFISNAFTGHMIGSEPILPPLLQRPKGLVGEDFILADGCMLSLLALAHPVKPVETVRDDKWTVIDKHRHPSVAFSHMVLVREGRPQIVTAEYPVQV